MRSLVDFLTYEVALGHWWVIIIGLFSRENMVCIMPFRNEVLPHMFLAPFRRFDCRFVSQLMLQMG